MSDHRAGHDDLFEQVHRHVTARIAGETTADDFAALDALLDGSAAARHLYVQYVYETLALSSLLGAADSHGAADAHGSAGILPVDSPRHFTGETPVPPGPEDAIESELGELESDVPAVEPLFPPIIIRTSPAIPVPAFSLSSSLGGWLFSYAVAMVLTGVAILGAWVYTVSHDGELAMSPPVTPAPERRDVEPKLESVGQVTGTFDCRGTDRQAVSVGAPMTVGRRYDLASGLLEIGYQSGAKVILQGPCSYVVDSPAGGFLSLGKLTARVESKREGGRGNVDGADNPKSEIRNPKSPFPLRPSPFVVRTPTAVVTDLGTEFGVEVDRSGVTRSHVFRGRVELRVAGGGDEHSKPILLAENDSAQGGGWQGPGVNRRQGRPRRSRAGQLRAADAPVDADQAV